MSVVVDESAESVVEDAVQPDAGHEAALKHARRYVRERRRRRLKSTEYCPNFFVCESRKVGRDFGPTNFELPRCPFKCLLADGGCR